MTNIRLAITSLLVLFALCADAPAETQTVRLDELETENILTGWGEVSANQSVSGGPLRIGGETFEHGVGVHAVSYARIEMDGKAQRFTAMVGVDDVMRGKGSIKFIVMGDRKELWNSGLMKGGNKAMSVDVDLQGIRILELTVSDAGNGNGQDHANWAEAAIAFDGARPVIVSVDSAPKVPTPLSPTNRSEARAALIPYPRNVTWSDGHADFTTVTYKMPPDDDVVLGHVATTLKKILADAGCKVVHPADAGPGVTRIEIAEAPVAGAPTAKGAYRLEISTAGRVRMSAPETSGLFYGVQTLRQLIGEESGKPVVPACTITDWPAFEWRGFMHDVGRNFQDLELLKHFIDVMAQYKMSIFHMHLTDRPGYRVESKKYPELNDPKNYRKTRRPGKFYTFDELNDFIEYCRLRHILVVPEIDMPGHSDYFPKTFGVDMQDPKGMDITEDLLNEFFDHVDLPYFHIGSDEVHLKNKAFMPRMAGVVRDHGKDVIVWRPGHLPKGDVITQLWTGKARPISGLRYLDSQANYINHMDAFTGPVRAFMQQPCRVPRETDVAMGGILCHWPDNNVGDQKNVYIQSPVLPALLAYAERIWRGAEHNRSDAWAKLPPTDDEAFQEWAEFEDDMVEHRDRFLKSWPFQYVKQSDIPWKLIGPFPHGGDTLASFPVEEGIRDEYTVNGETYRWRKGESRGATIHVNHFFGFPGHLPKSSPGTVYGLTYIYSPKDQDVGFWIGFNGQSRAGGRRSGPTPEQGQWSVVNSKVWVNDEEVPPPRWAQPGVSGSPEIPFIDENYFHRKSTTVHLREGWNKVFVKAPHGKPAWKWAFTCVPVEWNGKHAREVEGLRFATEPPSTR